MTKYIVKRVLLLIPILLIASMVVFGLNELSSGDAARVMAEKIYEYPTASQVEQVRHENGLDKPLYVQYGRWLKNAVKGDFGASYNTGKAPSEMLKEAAPKTLKVAVIGFVLLLLIGIPLGIISALFEGSAADKVIQGFSFFSVAMPSFWLGLILLYIFGVKLNVISILAGSGFGVNFLAAITLDIGYFGILIRLVRTTMLEVLEKNYIIACKARGIPMRRIILHHAFKNTAVPILTQVSVILVSLICGSVIVESIFSIRGLGEMVLTAVNTKDIPVLQCFILTLAAVVVVINLIVDICYSLIDKRIQLT